jgi:hypothetical protein
MNNPKFVSSLIFSDNFLELNREKFVTQQFQTPISFLFSHYAQQATEQKNERLEQPQIQEPKIFYFHFLSSPTITQQPSREKSLTKYYKTERKPQFPLLTLSPASKTEEKFGDPNPKNQKFVSFHFSYFSHKPSVALVPVERASLLDVPRVPVLSVAIVVRVAARRVPVHSCCFWLWKA